MNEQNRNECEHFETLMASWFEGDIHAPDRDALTAHLDACASCRESFALAQRMEEALVSRRAEVPAVDAFLPAFSPVRRPFAHPGLVAVFRALMSPAGIAIMLVMWSTMLAFRYRETVAGWFEWSSSARFTLFLNEVSSSLLGVSGGDAYTLVAIYVVLALLVLGSTGAITLRFIRHS